MTGNNIHGEKFLFNPFFNCETSNIQAKVIESVYSVKKAW